MRYINLGEEMGGKTDTTFDNRQFKLCLKGRRSSESFNKTIR